MFKMLSSVEVFLLLFIQKSIEIEKIPKIYMKYSFYMPFLDRKSLKIEKTPKYDNITSHSK